MKDRIFFKGLDEIRAMAALLVFFFHVETIKQREGMASLFEIPFLKVFMSQIGHFSVLCFFVLSGFLITFLLLSEKEKTGSVSIPAFYMRRVLRIWPLYFLTVFIGFAFLPVLSQFTGFGRQLYYPGLIERLNYSALPLFLLMLSNYAMLYFTPVAGAAHSWSVSLEEQFYLVWPWVVKGWSNPVRLRWFLMMLIPGKLLLAFALSRFLPSDAFLLVFLKTFSIQYMAAGALLACFWYEKKLDAPLFSFLGNPLFALLWGLTILLVCGYSDSGLLVALMCGVLILSFIKSGIRIPLLAEAGKISYGIYMLHPLCIMLSLPLVEDIQHPALFQAGLYALSLGSTLLLSTISFRWFEQFFLRLKPRFSPVASGRPEDGS